MKTKSLMILALLVILTANGCSLVTDLALKQEVISIAKAELAAQARELAVEISHVQAEVEAYPLSPAEKANNIRGEGRVCLEFIYRCRDVQRMQDWQDCGGCAYYKKVGNKWDKWEGEGWWWSKGTFYPPVHCKLFVPPKDWREIAENRRVMEKWDKRYLEYKNGQWIWDFDNIKDYTKIPLFTALLGPTWMFVPERKGWLESWLGQEFTDEEIIKFQTDPEKASQMIRMLEDLQRSGKVDSDVVEFYRKALTYEGRREIYDKFYGK
jgi:hypothetical protein